MTFPDETFTGILILLVYVPACPILYWWLVRPLPLAFRRLAALMLAVQLVLVGVALLYTPASLYERWLWNLDQESNIPSMLSSAQLALVGAVAFIASWRAKRLSARHCAITAGYGLLFSALAIAEFTHSKATIIVKWYIPYLVLAGSLASVTLITIETSPKPARLWLLYLLMALSLMVLGGILIDHFTFELCDGFLDIFRLEGCINKYHLEEVLELFGGWVALVAMLGQLGEYERRPSALVRRTLFLFPAVWILLITQLFQPPPVSRQSATNGASVVFESGATLHAYAVKPGDSSYTFHIYLSNPPDHFNSQGYSVHIIDPISQDVLVSDDKILKDHKRMYMAPGYTPTYLQWMRLPIPPNAPRNHALWAVLTLWRAEGAEFLPQPIQSSDLPLLSDTQIILGELVLPALSSPPPPPAPLAYFDNGFTLDPVTLPNEAQAGGTISLPFTWRADAADGEEYAQFLHLGDEASGQWWIFDQHPLGARLPTQFWFEGLADTEAWHLTLPADLPSGRYSVFTGLYRTSDNEGLPASNLDGVTFVDARVPLGHLNLAGDD